MPRSRLVPDHGPRLAPSAAPSDDPRLAESGADREHRSWSAVNRVDDLAAVDPWEVDRRDPEVRVP